MKGIGSNSVSLIVISFPVVRVVWKKFTSGFINFQRKTLLFSSCRCRSIRLLTPPINTFRYKTFVSPFAFETLIVMLLAQLSAWSRIFSDSLYNCAGRTTSARMSCRKTKKSPSPLPVNISFHQLKWYRLHASCY